MQLWIKALHVIFMVTWMAGIFYLPRLFVYHAMCEPDDKVGIERFKVMERKLYFGIMTPGMVLTMLFGIWLIELYGGVIYVRANAWLHAKFTLILLLFAYHVHCFFLLRSFKHDRNTRSHRFFRVYNEIPVLMLVGIVILVIVKPF